MTAPHRIAQSSFHRKLGDCVAATELWRMLWGRLEPQQVGKLMQTTRGTREAYA